MLLASGGSFRPSLSSSPESSLPLEGGRPSSAVSPSALSLLSHSSVLSGSFPAVLSCPEGSLSFNEPWMSPPSFTATVSVISASVFAVPPTDPGCFSSLSVRDGVLCWACSSGAAWSGLGLERSSGEGLGCRPPSPGLSPTALSPCPAME